MPQHESPTPGAGHPTLDEVGESGVLEAVFARLRPGDAGRVLVGPGDDTAYLELSWGGAGHDRHGRPGP